jgi:hypothetical protein
MFKAEAPPGLFQVLYQECWPVCQLPTFLH